ncbi:hypothetical protein RvY_15452 [Ramazzottius varieornatus]|uniref:ATP synthase subunit epsilon, mitochondrial n=1 Tax=Ramazzottius varieornatus TaxID=947166 RepID=A0A1D1VUY9_RAMVA|nr:hypothetical protein RvY_15452 [Ramazzottius varieornatus]
MAAAWRVAGLNYIKYSQIAARCVRQALKEEYKVEAAKRGEASAKVTKWTEGRAAAAQR